MLWVTVAGLYTFDPSSHCKDTHPHTGGTNTSWERAQTLSPWVWSKSADQLVWVSAIDFSSHLLAFGPGEHLHDNVVLINGGECYLSLQSANVVKSVLLFFLCMFIKKAVAGWCSCLTEMSCNPWIKILITEGKLLRMGTQTQIFKHYQHQEWEITLHP